MAYIKAFSPLAAQRMALRLRAAGDSLADFPERGRAARYSRRELTVVKPYVITYRIRGDVVQILRIRHGAQQPD